MTPGRTWGGWEVAEAQWARAEAQWGKGVELIKHEKAIKEMSPMMARDDWARQSLSMCERVQAMTEPQRWC